MEKSIPDQSQMFSLKTSEDSPSVIGSPALQVGRSRSKSQAGKIPVVSGLVLAPVNRSRKPAKEKPQPIHGIYGPTFIDSSARAAPMSSLESRCLQRLAMVGSMEYDLTLRLKTTPSKHSIFRLAGSARRTRETVCTGLQLDGYPTPNTPSGGPNVRSTETHTGGVDLEGCAVLMAGYPTPNAHPDAPNMST